MLEGGGDIKDLPEFIKNNKGEIERTMKLYEAQTEQIKQVISSLPSDKKVEYETLGKQFEHKGLPTEKKIELQEEMTRIIENAMNVP